MTVAIATRTAAYALVTHGVLSRAAVVCKTAGCARRVPDLLCDPCSPVILRLGAGVGSMATGATYDPR